MTPVFFIVAAQIMLESLPLSSSTHVHLLGCMAAYYGYQLPPWFFERSFDFLMHAPTFFVVALFLIARFYEQLRHVSWPSIIFWGSRLFLSTLVTVLLYPVMRFLGDFFPECIGLMMTAGALFFSAGARRQQCAMSDMTMGHACFIGFVQACALLPGISRMASTLAAGVWCGFSPLVSLYYSCLLQIPLFGAAGFVGFILQIMHGMAVSWTGACMCIISMVGAYGLLLVVERMIKRQQLWYIGIYVTCLAVLLCIFGSCI